MSLSLAERALTQAPPRPHTAPERRERGTLWRDDTASPWPALVVVAALGLLSILSLLRVFTSPIFLMWAIPAVGMGATAALTYGRKSLAVAFALLIGFTTLTLPSLFAKELTYRLVPTRAAWRLVGTLMASGLSGMMSEETPVPADARYLIVLWSACLAGGFLGASWIVVGRPLGAILTSLGLLVYAGSVGVGGGRDLVAFAATVLVGTFLLLDGRHRLATWSRPVRRVPPAFGTPVLAAACVLALLGPFLLGSRTPLLELETAFRPRIVIIKPLSDVKRQLDVEPPVEVMRVRASDSAYWRLTALDDYTGTEWLLEARPEPVKSGRVSDPQPPTRGKIIGQEYSITSLLAPWLPAAFAANRVDSPLPFDADKNTSTLLLRDETLPGLRYRVTSQVPAAETPPAVPSAPAGEPEAGEAAFAGIARPIVARARNPYEQALALQNHFRRSFRYDEKVTGGHDRARLQRFLEQRTGYCEQFAAVMTLMLRGLGTPARVAVGFLPGRVSGGEHVVTTKDAHAWVEALIPGMGWMEFDPTPGRGTPPSALEQPEEATAAEEPTPPPPPAAQASPTPEPAEAGQGAAAGARFPTRGVIAVILVALAAATVPGAKDVRRRLRRSGEPSRSVLGAYAELADRVADFGSVARASQTQWELWRRAFHGGRQAGAESAARVVRAASWTLYGPATTAAGDADRAWADQHTAVRELARAHPFARRIRALFDPRTLISGVRGRSERQRAGP